MFFAADGFLWLLEFESFYYWCMYGMCLRASGGQRATFGHQFSPSMVGDTELKLPVVYHKHFFFLLLRDLGGPCKVFFLQFPCILGEVGKRHEQGEESYSFHLPPNSRASVKPCLISREHQLPILKQAFRSIVFTYPQFSRSDMLYTKECLEFDLAISLNVLC